MCLPPSSSRWRTPKALAERFDRAGQVNLGRAGHDAGDLILPQHGKVVARDPLADDADQVAAVEIAAGRR